MKTLLMVCFALLPIAAEARCWGANGYCTRERHERERAYNEQVERTQNLQYLQQRSEAIKRNALKPGADQEYYKHMLKRIDEAEKSGP